MTYLNHITLSTVHIRSGLRSDMHGETLAHVGPWLAALIDAGGLMPLPVSRLVDCSAMATVHNGGSKAITSCCHTLAPNYRDSHATRQARYPVS